MSKKSKSGLLFFILIILLLTFSLQFILSSVKKDDNLNNDTTIESNIEIISSDIEFEQNAMMINLISGEIKSNAKISNVFINVNGYGCEYLDYTQTLGFDGYYITTLLPKNNILNTVFGSNIVLSADIYVEYNGISNKVSTETINVVSNWI